jgi:hypothetical protein
VVEQEETHQLIPLMGRQTQAVAVVEKDEVWNQNLVVVVVRV